ncbi:MAG: hypothetical protein QM690_08500 [Sphingobium sp.]
MTGVEIGFDAARGVLLCRVAGAMPPSQEAELSRALTDAVGAARRHGPLRVLWDNRVGVPLSTALSDLLRDLLVERGGVEDRVAIVVPNSMAKAHSRAHMAEGHQLFASENAALTWLSVGASPAAAA